MAILAYLDDFLAAGQDRSAVTLWAQQTRLVFDAMGFSFKERKCQWDPVQEKRHLGVIIDTKRALFLVPQDKIKKIQDTAETLITMSRVPAKKLAQFCGLGISIHLAFPPARFFLQALYGDLTTKRSWRDRVRLSPQAIADLQAWTNIARWNGRAVAPDSLPLIGTMATDACPSGWGATFTAPGHTLVMSRGFFNRVQAHINVRELQAVRLGIETFFPKTSGIHTTPRRIRLQVDNQVVMYVLRNLTTPSLDLMTELRALFYILLIRVLVREAKGQVKRTLVKKDK